MKIISLVTFTLALFFYLAHFILLNFYGYGLLRIAGLFSALIAILSSLIIIMKGKHDIFIISIISTMIILVLSNFIFLSIWSINWGKDPEVNINLIEIAKHEEEYYERYNKYLEMPPNPINFNNSPIDPFFVKTGKFKKIDGWQNLGFYPTNVLSARIYPEYRWFDSFREGAALYPCGKVAFSYSVEIVNGDYIIHAVKEGKKEGKHYYLKRGSKVILNE